jgi:hypothetical protein
MDVEVALAVDIGVFVGRGVPGVAEAAKVG